MTSYCDRHARLGLFMAELELVLNDIRLRRTRALQNPLKTAK